MLSEFHVTNKGQQYITKAISGKILVITRGQYGSGKLQEGMTLQTMTALVQPLADLPISKQTVSQNSITIKTQFSNRVNGKILAPFHLMEAGIFAKVKNADGTDDAEAPETLIFYANELTEEKADYIPAVLTEFIINWPFTTSDAESIIVEIDESLIYPTMAEFNDRTPHNATAGGTGKELAVSVEDVPLKDSLHLMVTLENDLEADATIKYNDGTAYPIYNANGTSVFDKQQTAGSTLHVAFNEEKACWYIIGGGTAEIATDEEAEEGTDDTKMMTPQKVALYVDKKLGDVNAILDSINGKEI